MNVTMTTEDKAARMEELRLKADRTPEEDKELENLEQILNVKPVQPATQSSPEVTGEQPVNPEDSSPTMTTTEDPGMNGDDKEEEDKEPDEDTGRDQDDVQE